MDDKLPIARERLTEHVGFYVTPSMKADIDALRKEQGVSESDLMRFIVRSFLEKIKDKADEKPQNADEENH